MDVLVLSHCWQPIRRVSWQEAFGYVFAGRAEVVRTYEDRVVRSARQEWAVPSIVRFVQATARLFRRVGVRFSRRTVYARDMGRCQYCGRHLALREFTIDHVLPTSRGGTTRWDNVVTCCAPCNRRKADRTPTEARMRLLARPAKPRTLGPGGLNPWSGGMPDDWKDYLLR